MRFEKPLKGYYIVNKRTDQPVLGVPAFKTEDEAQKYKMTKMFANHQNYKVKLFENKDIVLQIEGFLDKIFGKKDSQSKQSEGFKQMMTAAAMLRDELSHIEFTVELQQFKEDDLEDFKDDWITHGPEDVVPQAQVQYDRLINLVNKKYKKVD